MENVAELKAEFVNEIEFIPSYKFNRFQEKKDILSPYNSDFEAVVAVKVGNLVHTITLSEQIKYVSSSYNKNNEYVGGYDLIYYDLSKESKKLFKSILDAGIQINFNDIYTQYFKDIEIAKHKLAVIARAKSIAVIAKRREEYKTSWIQTFESVISGDKNKKIQEGLSHTSFKKSSEEKALMDMYAVTVTYRGFTTNFFKDEDSFKYNTGSVYELPEGENIHTAENVYSFQRIINPNNKGYNHKDRKMKKAGSLFFKYMAEIDSYIGSRTSRITRLSKEETERNEKRDDLIMVSGLPVHIFSETKYSKDHNGRSTGEHYKVYSYVIVTKQPKYSHSAPDGFSISSHQPQKYNSTSETYEPLGEKEYSIRGLCKLSKEQFQGILKILMENMEAIKKVVYIKS